MHESHITTQGMEGLAWQTIAARLGTPFYAYSAATLADTLMQLRRHLPAALHLFYSLKANPNLSLVMRLHGLGVGCEVCSLVELETALLAGAGPSDILFVGPGKSPQELARCVEQGIQAVIVESEQELADLQRIAAAAGRQQRVGLRVNPEFQSRKARLLMGGKPCQFGIDPTCVAGLIARRKDYPALDIAGLHVYLGTRILEAEAVVENTANILALARLLTAGGWHPAFIDIGGGLGVPYFDQEAMLDLAALGAGLAPLVVEHQAALPDTALYMELGRFLVAECGVFVTAVRYTKQSKGRLFAICDGGSNCHSAAAGGGLVRKPFPLARLGPAGDLPLLVQTLGGPLCTPSDIIGDRVELPALSPGDLIGIFRSGAYGASASPVQFLGFGHPAEVLVDGEALWQVRARDHWQRMVAEQKPRLLPPVSHAASPNMRLCDEQIAPSLRPIGEAFTERCSQLETQGDALDEVWHAFPLLREISYIGLPSEFNPHPLRFADVQGGECPYPLHLAIIEQLARYDANGLMALPGASLSTRAVRELGDAAQQRHFFGRFAEEPHWTFFAVSEPEVGSDASQVRSAWRPDGGGVRVSADKMLIGSVTRASIGVLYLAGCQGAAPRLAMFEPGAHPGRVHATLLPSVGLPGAGLGRLRIEDCLLPVEAMLGNHLHGLQQGLNGLARVFQRHRPMVAAMALGTARGLLDTMADHGVAGLEPWYLRYRALGRMLEQVALRFQQGSSSMAGTSQIKVLASGFAEEVARLMPHRLPKDAWIQSHTLRRRYLDAHAFEYMEGTRCIHLQHAARAFQPKEDRHGLEA